jgi:iron-sulfur cluster repair protein YtfE (RIC family)
MTWPGADMARLMERHPRLALNALQFVAARLHELQVHGSSADHGRPPSRNMLMTITEDMTVADIAWALPSSVRVFQRHGIDFCCGGRTPLVRACRERGVPVATLVQAIEAAAHGPANDERDWNREPLRALIDHIVSTYHDALREELPRLESMAATVARVHGTRASHLARLEMIVSQLSTELGSHMRKEETGALPCDSHARRQATSAGHPSGGTDVGHGG